MGAKLARLWAAGWQGWIVLGEACVMVFLVDLGLRLMGFKRLSGLLDQHRTPDDALLTTSQWRTAKEIRRLVAVACLYYPARAECLHRSLVGYWMIRRRGIPVSLCIGVSTEEEFAAHAWIEAEGEVVWESPGVREEYALILKQ